jgi:hypothetical protein
MSQIIVSIIDKYGKSVILSIGPNAFVPRKGDRIYIKGSSSGAEVSEVKDVILNYLESGDTAATVKVE